MPNSVIRNNIRMKVLLKRRRIHNPNLRVKLIQMEEIQKLPTLSLMLIIREERRARNIPRK